MTQYINKNALVAEIESERKLYLDKEEYDFGWNNALDKILSLIDTLEVKEVDLEKEVDTWRHNHFHGRRDKDASGEYLERSSQLDIAKHFFEFGLKSKSSYVGIPNIDDTLKEMGVDPDSKDVKIFKESFYEALENLKKRKENSNG